ncbi:unnamed protein product [Leptosia nina]|uniref:Sodium channel protein Nach n=1 Tax=Leptosia nina TaxID=320188 RepID=A0AAV1JTC9_9NEOP
MTSKLSIFESVTTVHGFNKLTRGSSKKIWRSALFANFLLTISYLIVIRNRKSSNISEGRIELFLQSLPNLIDYDNPNERNDNFTDILHILNTHYFSVETIMQEMHQKCADLLLYCTFNRKVKNCSEIFTLIKTYEGHCCAFNYAALNDDSGQMYEAIYDDDDDDVEHYEDSDDNKHLSIVVTSESGRGSGLLVVYNVDPTDYPRWSLSPSYGAKILISDPNDYPEVTVLYKRADAGQSLDLKVQAYIFQVEEDLRRIDPINRGCVFHDEVKLEHTDRFSTETCRTECRMKSYLNYCGCVPYKYPKEPASSRFCDFKDLECLNHFRAKGSRLERCDPLCYFECRDQRYSITGDVTPLLAELYPSNVMSGHNLSELSSLRVYFDKPTCNCYKQMLLMDFTTFVGILKLEPRNLLLKIVLSRKFLMYKRFLMKF